MSFETTGTIASFGGKLLKLKHKSSSTNTDMELNLFMPPQAANSGAKIPVLIYLSGLTCTGNNCSEKGFFQHGAAKHGIAVVYPDTSPSTWPSLSTKNGTNINQEGCRLRVKTRHTISALVPASTLMQPRNHGLRATTCTRTSPKSFQKHSFRLSRSLIPAESASQVTAWAVMVL
jgi:hypothetical protein